MPSLNPQQQQALMRMLAQRARSGAGGPDPLRRFATNQVRGQAQGLGRQFAQDLFRDQVQGVGRSFVPEGLRALGSNLSAGLSQITPYLPMLQAARARDPGAAAVQLVGTLAARAAAQQAAGAAASGAASSAAGAGMPSFMGFNPVTALYAISQLSDAYDARKEAKTLARDLGRWGQDQEETDNAYVMPWIHLDKIANPGNSELMRQLEALYAGYSPEEMAAAAGRMTVDQMRQQTGMDENPWNGTQADLDQQMQQRFRDMLKLELYNQYANAFREGKTDVFGNPVEGSGFSYARPQAATYRGGPVTGDNLWGNVMTNPYTGVANEWTRDLRAGGFFNPTYADPSSPMGGGADNQYYSYRRGMAPMAVDPAEQERRAREAANRAAFGNFTPVTPPAQTTPSQPTAQQPIQPAPAYGRNSEFSTDSFEPSWYLGGQGA